MGAETPCHLEKRSGMGLRGPSETSPEVGAVLRRGDNPPGLVQGTVGKPTALAGGRREPSGQASRTDGRGQRRIGGRARSRYNSVTTTG